MTTARRLGLGFFVLIALMLVISASSYVASHKLGAAIEATFKDRVVPLEQLSNIQRMTLRDRILVMTWCNQCIGGQHRQAQRRTQAQRQGLRRELEGVHVDQAHRQRRRSWRTPFGKAHAQYYSEGINPAADALKAGQIDQASSLMQKKVSTLAPAAATCSTS
jgi:hypothetical protein